MWIEEKGQRLAKDLAKGEDKPETSVKVGTEVERSRGMHRMAKNVIWMLDGIATPKPSETFLVTETVTAMACSAALLTIGGK